MFEKLRRALKPKTDTDDPQQKHLDHHIAAAVLLIEAATLDGVFDKIEKDTIISVLSQGFDLDPEATAELVDVAIERHEDAVELFAFTNKVKAALNEAERIEMMEMLWQVVYADQTLHDYEANLMRRLAGLLHVPDRASGEARKRVLQRLGNGAANS
jgi:uncharacterized tellurite resistance protein B-like protein